MANVHVTSLNGLAFGGIQVPLGASINVGTEDTDVVTCNIQLYADPANTQELENTAVVTVYVSDAATGIGLAATAPDGGIAAGTDGAEMMEVVAGKLGMYECEADGDLDIAVTESGTDTFYLVVLLPTGQYVVSGALTFAA